MKIQKGKLVFFCGKMGAGKTTKSKAVAHKLNAVLLSEDEWLESLFPKAIQSLTDYVHYSNLLKPPIKKLVQNILLTGSNVVMDFPGNTIKQRSWFKEIFTEINAQHELIYLNISNEVCLKQIANRCAKNPARAATDTVEMFNSVTQYFQAPEIKEGFNVVLSE